MIAVFFSGLILISIIVMIYAVLVILEILMIDTVPVNAFISI